MKKTILFTLHLFCSVIYGQTFNGDLGANSLKWSTEQKDFNSLPRAGITPMSIKLWNNYNGVNAPSQYGSLLELYGMADHLVSQLYFKATWEGGQIMYRSAFYGDSTWNDWRNLLDSKSDVETSGNLQIKGSSNSYISNANVGIGTASPNSRLSIKVGTKGVSIHPGTPGSHSYYGTIAFNRESATGEIFDNNAYAFQINNGNNDYDKNLHFQIYNTSGGLVSNNALVINGVSGNVGIGTSNATSMLTVAGNIASREVKVSVDAGADFVFNKDYDLPSLESIDNFIKENKHLPEIASAEEMKKDGINLSEMNIKLLQKIEELTLYMIEQNNQLKAQNDQINLQNQEIQLLKKSK
ncbi:hypothetical protein [Flavobacterium branchiicola]|uniref:Peptidase S74 domain-containing protein n=1 Tax=Flavobacterium branchiicola TaxID=1114875 RepID=A0ABV9PJN5_9FLAO|nr:hypothetical protein [Flavobacterium branchiicola]MBS7256726.1 hypothetical protein [Flavobacterium branchiicola]